MNAGINLFQFGFFLWWLRRVVTPHFPTASHLRRSLPMLVGGVAVAVGGSVLCRTPWAEAYPILALAVGLASSIGFFGLGLALRLADKPEWRRSGP
jgi:hypothetical protein